MSKDAYARPGGTAPLPVWSGKRARHRLSRSGNRNYRLAAIRSFFRQAAMNEPAHAAQIARVLSIPHKRYHEAQISYLDHDPPHGLMRRAADLHGTSIGPGHQRGMFSRPRTGPERRVVMLHPLRRRGLRHGKAALRGPTRKGMNPIRALAALLRFCWAGREALAPLQGANPRLVAFRGKWMRELSILAF
ncbi:MAG: hypothetical protein ACOYO9_12925 [Candidatus Nanopelagicales bacterium]